MSGTMSVSSERSATSLSTGNTSVPAESGEFPTVNEPKEKFRKFDPGQPRADEGSTITGGVEDEEVTSRSQIGRDIFERSEPSISRQQFNRIADVVGVDRNRPSIEERTRAGRLENLPARRVSRQSGRNEYRDTIPISFDNEMLQRANEDFENPQGSLTKEDMYEIWMNYLNDMSFESSEEGRTEMRKSLRESHMMQWMMNAAKASYLISDKNWNFDALSRLVDKTTPFSLFRPGEQLDPNGEGNLASLRFTNTGADDEQTLKRPFQSRRNPQDKAAAQHMTLEDPQGRLIVVFTGSQRGLPKAFTSRRAYEDWIRTNLRDIAMSDLFGGNLEAIGNRGQQEARFVQQLSKQYPNREMMFVGHSLGGILSRKAAEYYDWRAFTFNYAASPTEGFRSTFDSAFPPPIRSLQFFVWNDSVSNIGGDRQVQNALPSRLGMEIVGPSQRDRTKNNASISILAGTALQMALKTIGKDTNMMFAHSAAPFVSEEFMQKMQDLRPPDSEPDTVSRDRVLRPNALTQEGNTLLQYNTPRFQPEVLGGLKNRLGLEHGNTKEDLVRVLTTDFQEMGRNLDRIFSTSADSLRVQRQNNNAVELEMSRKRRRRS